MPRAAASRRAAQPRRQGVWRREASSDAEAAVGQAALAALRAQARAFLVGALTQVLVSDPAPSGGHRLGRAAPVALGRRGQVALPDQPCHGVAFDPLAFLGGGGAVRVGVDAGGGQELLRVLWKL